MLKWNSGSWSPGTDNNTTYSAGTGLQLSDTTFSAKTTQALWNANQLQGNTVSTTSPSTGQVLQWSGTQWSPATQRSKQYSAGTGLLLTDTVFSAKTDSALWNANQLQGIAVSDSAPAAGEVLTYLNGKWKGTRQTSNGWKIDTLSADTVVMYSTVQGSVGIGTTHPKGLFQVQGGNTNDPDSSFIITRGGNVGIGTQSPDSRFKLSVNGWIRAKKIVVESGWADYVFEEDYPLMSMDSLALYVSAHHHLPGVPSAAEVTQGGLDVGEMQVKMMEKIEELTLYMLELKQENAALKARLDEMQAQSAGGK